jgi:hypothetical protein
MHTVEEPAEVIMECWNEECSMVVGPVRKSFRSLFFSCTHTNCQVRGRQSQKEEKRGGKGKETGKEKEEKLI